MRPRRSLSQAHWHSSLRWLLLLTVKVNMLGTPHLVGAWSIIPASSRNTRRSSPVSSYCSTTTKLEQQVSSSTVSGTTDSEIHTKIHINPLLNSIQPSKTVEIFSLVQQLRSQGETVTSLCVGEPDFPPFPAILQRLHDAVDQTDTRYTAVTGTIQLRRAIAHDLQQRKGLVYDANQQIIVANGAKQCVFQALWALAGTGDAVLIPAPYWPSYPEQVRLTGAEPILVETLASNGYLLPPAVLRETLTQHPNIKVLILCHPSNPTGAVYSQPQLQELADVLRDFPQVTVLADEIYERLVYNDPSGACPSLAQCPGMQERTVLINGFSKAYALTGLRVGYVATSNNEVARAITTLQSQLTSCAGSLSQAAAVAALEQVSESEIAGAVQVMREKRDYCLERLRQMQGVTVNVEPMGAFYIMASIHECVDDTDFCVRLLREQKLALVPGSSFGAPGTVRLSYATSMEELETALDKLEMFLVQHEKKVA